VEDEEFRNILLQNLKMVFSDYNHDYLAITLENEFSKITQTWVEIKTCHSFLLQDFTSCGL